MFESLSTPLLIGVFASAAAAVYATGRPLSDATDRLADRWGLGEALGGMVLLAVVTNLPEVAITTSAAFADNVSMAIGNILGGIAIQTVVLALIDAFGGRHPAPLTGRIGSLSAVLEGLLVIVVLAVTVLGVMLPDSLMIGRVSPPEIGIAVAWVAGLRGIARARRGLPWALGATPDGGSSPETLAPRRRGADRAGTGRSLAVFLVCAVVTLAAGVLLERSSDLLADRLGMRGVVFGATLLALTTSLPEIATGVASARWGGDELAVSDIFGGNAFLPLLFLLASAITGQAVLPAAGHVEVYLTALGMLLTAIYLGGLLFRPRRRIAGMGPDSWLVVLVYGLGVVGLLAFPGA